MFVHEPFFLLSSDKEANLLDCKSNLSICQNFEKSQKICKMGLPRLTKQIKLAHEG